MLTHHARDPLTCLGGTVFTFVTEGIESALDLARAGAVGRDVALAGGAETARQYLAADLVDEMEINLVSVLLGTGERLLGGLGTGVPTLRHVRTISTPVVTHLRFAR